MVTCYTKCKKLGDRTGRTKKRKLMGQDKDSSIGGGKKNAGIKKEVLQPLL